MPDKCTHCSELIEQDPDSGEFLHIATDEPTCAGFESVAEPA